MQVATTLSGMLRQSVRKGTDRRWLTAALDYSSTETFKYNKYDMFYMAQVTIRDVDSAVFREFKAEAIKRGMKIGSALTLAMEKFRADLGKKRAKFTALRPTHWGDKRISEDVDAILYGT